MQTPGTDCWRIYNRFFFFYQQPRHPDQLGQIRTDSFSEPSVSEYGPSLSQPKGFLIVRPDPEVHAWHELLPGGSVLSCLAMGNAPKFHGVSHSSHEGHQISNAPPIVVSLESLALPYGYINQDHIRCTFSRVSPLVAPVREANAGCRSVSSSSLSTPMDRCILGGVECPLPGLAGQRSVEPDRISPSH